MDEQKILEKIEVDKSKELEVCVTGSDKEQLDNIVQDLIAKQNAKNSLRNFRFGVDIALDVTALLHSIERLIKTGGAKISNLFIVLYHPTEQGETRIELSEANMKHLREVLCDPELQLTRPELKEHLDTNKITCYFGYWIPKSFVLDDRKFDRNILKQGVKKNGFKQFKSKRGKESHLTIQ